MAKKYFDKENEDFAAKSDDDGVTVFRKSKKDPKELKRMIKQSDKAIDAKYERKRLREPKGDFGFFKHTIKGKQ